MSSFDTAGCRWCGRSEIASPSWSIEPERSKHDFRPFAFDAEARKVQFADFRRLSKLDPISHLQLPPIQGSVGRPFPLKTFFGYPVSSATLQPLAPHTPGYIDTVHFAADGIGLSGSSQFSFNPKCPQRDPLSYSNNINEAIELTDAISPSSITSDRSTAVYQLPRPHWIADCDPPECDSTPTLSNSLADPITVSEIASLPVCAASPVSTYDATSSVDSAHRFSSASAVKHLHLREADVMSSDTNLATHISALPDLQLAPDSLKGPSKSMPAPHMPKVAKTVRSRIRGHWEDNEAAAKLSRGQRRSLRTPFVVGFIDLTAADHAQITRAVGVSGNARTRARRKRETAKKEQKFVATLLTAVDEAGGNSASILRNSEYGIGFRQSLPVEQDAIEAI